MNGEIVTPQEARQIARRLFLKLYPDQEDWFDLAWDCYARLGSQPTTKVTLANLPGLGVAAQADPFTRETIEAVVTLAFTFLIKSPTTRTELLERLRQKVQSPSQPKAYALWLHEFGGILREVPQGNSTSLSEKEQEWIKVFRGLGRYESSFDGYWLRLPSKLCNKLGLKRMEEWFVFDLDPKRLIAFPLCLWDLFWVSAKAELSLTEESVKKFQKSCETTVYKEQKAKEVYRNEYWIVPKNVMKGLNFTGKDHEHSVSKNSLQCQITHSNCWLEITPRVAS